MHLAVTGTVDPSNFSTGLRETTVDGLELVGRGKVRDKYQLPSGHLLIVTTDRISVGDMIVGTVPGKGAVLNMLSAYWFDRTGDIMPNHKVSVPHPNVLICERADRVLPVEVVLRRYMASSMSSTSIYYSYSRGERTIYGIRFPDDLEANQELPMGTIITPTTKSEEHDAPLTDAEAAELVDAETSRGTWAQVKTVAVQLFDRATEVMKRAGLLLVDTKIEFGLDRAGRLMVIDELFTPDSSRLWLADSYGERLAAGKSPQNFDKEKVRAFLYEQQGWRPDKPCPCIPDELKTATYEAYATPYRMITGQSMPSLPTDPHAIEEEIRQVVREVAASVRAR